MRRVLVVDSSGSLNGKLTKNEEYSTECLSSCSTTDLYNSNYDLIILVINRNETHLVQTGRLLKERSLLVVLTIKDQFKKYLFQNLNIDCIYIDEFNNELVQAKIKPMESINQNFIECIQSNIMNFNKKRSIIESCYIQAALNIDTIEKSISYLFNAISLISKNDIIVIMLKVARETRVYSHITPRVHKKNYDNFLKFCYHSHYENISVSNLENSEGNIVNISNNPDFYTSILDKREISSYFFSPLNNSEGEVIGTIHLGNYINNYFNNDIIRGNLLENFYLIGSIIDANIKYNSVIRDNREVRYIFSKFVPDRVIDKHLELGRLEKGGELKKVAILFTDIRAFTAISEKNSADAVVSFLNNYFNIMVGCIKSNGGVIDKFIGDAIVAIFGAPDEVDNPSQSAINAAKSIISSLSKVCLDGLILPESGFNMGIGIHVGESIVGNIGSDKKMSYTSIGDVVTLAEELESLTKKYDRTLLFSRDVAKSITDESVLLGNKNIGEMDLGIYGLK